MIGDSILRAFIWEAWQFSYALSIDSVRASGTALSSKGVGFGWIVLISDDLMGGGWRF